MNLLSGGSVGSGLGVVAGVVGTSMQERKVEDKVVKLGSDTFGNPIFEKVTKLAILPNYKCPGMLCPALPPRREVPKLDFQS